MASDPFKELGLAPGADRKAVRAAYAKLLRTVPPDADPERFQRLREARDGALARLKRQDEPSRPAPEEPQPTEKPAPAETLEPAEAPEPAETPEPVEWSGLEWLGIEDSHGPTDEPDPNAPDRWFSYWDWDAGTPLEMPEATATETDAPETLDPPVDDIAAIGLLGEDGQPPLTQFTLACVMLASDAIAPEGWNDVVLALHRLPLKDRIAMREPIAMEILIGDALRELAAREGGRKRGDPVPVETARAVAALAGELDWTSTGGLFEHIGGREGEALMRLVEERAADSAGGRVGRGENGLPTADAERLRPWLEPGAERYLAALERARERGRWQRGLHLPALFGGILWAARRRVVGAYPWLFGSYIACLAVLFVVSERVPDAAPKQEWLAIAAIWFGSNLWPALNAERYAVEAAAAFARDPASKPEGARPFLSVVLMGLFGVQAVLGLSLIASLLLEAVLARL